MRLFSKENKFQKFQIFLQKMFCAFWAWDMAPTLDVLVLLFFRLQSSHWSVHFLETILKPLEAKSRQGKLSPKGPPFIFYFFKETYKTGRT